MARQAKPKNAVRARYSDEYKAEALKLADKVGVGAAAKQLGLHESQLYGWRGRRNPAVMRSNARPLRSPS